MPFFQRSVDAAGVFRQILGPVGIDWSQQNVAAGMTNAPKMQAFFFVSLGDSTIMLQALLTSFHWVATSVFPWQLADIHNPIGAEVNHRDAAPAAC